MEESDKNVNELFICQCGNTEHQIVFRYLQDFHEVYAHIHLTPEYSFWRKVRMAFKYICGYRSRYGHFDEFIFKNEDADKLQKIVNFLKVK